MSNLDAIVSTVDDAVVPGLGYSLGTQQTASYVRERHFSTFYPSGSNVYSVASGQRVLRFLISDGSKSYLDLNTIRLCFDITNTSANARNLLLSGEHAACLFSRLTVRIAGVDVEDILYYNRYVGMLQNFRSVNSSRSSGINGVMTNATTMSFDTTIAEPIAQNATRTIVCELPCGLLQSHYLLPLAQFPLEIVLELVRRPEDVRMPGPSGGPNSTDFRIENATIKADTLTLDSAMDNTLSEALLQGKPLSLSISSWNNQYFQLTNLPADRASWSVVMSRSFSRLNSLFINFLPDMTKVAAGIWTESNLFSCWHGGTPFNANPVVPVCNRARDTFRFSLYAGARAWPTVPMASLGEAYYQMQKCIGQLQSETGTKIGANYRSTNFHLCMDLEKVSSTPASGGMAFSGLNTKASNDQLRFSFDDVTSLDADDNNRCIPQRMYVFAHHSVLIELRAEGVIVAT
jgi:hypothetical protein